MIKLTDSLFRHKKILLFVIIIVLFGIAVGMGTDFKKRSDLNTIVSTVYSYANEHEGRLPDTDGVDTQNSFPKKPTCVGSARGCFNLAKAGAASIQETIVPSYLKKIPSSPGRSESDTGYFIYKNNDGQIVGEAKGILGNTLTVKR